MNPTPNAPYADLTPRYRGRYSRSVCAATSASVNRAGRMSWFAKSRI